MILTTKSNVQQKCIQKFSNKEEKLMIKRLMRIGLFGLSLVGLLRTEVKAQGACEPSLLALYGICVVMNIEDFFVEGGSVEVASILKRLQNATTTAPAYEVTLFLKQVSARCRNPAGGSENANGSPFDLDVVLSETQTPKDFPISKNGRAVSEIVFSDDDLLSAIAPLLGTVCKPKWTLDKIAVNKMQVFGTLFSCENGGNQDNPRVSGCIVADALGKQCVVPGGQDPFKPPFTYDCGGTICDGISGPTACPQPPHELPSP
jgi:hypothetical protein